METSISHGIIFDIKRYAVDDGPGIRTTVFLKGCPLRCWWCHNPEGQSQAPELMYKRKRCQRCGECASVCPKGAILHLKGRMLIKRSDCDLCGKCSRKCPTGSLTIVGKEASVRDIVTEISKDKIFYEESGGGITVSGGEPMMQLDFLNLLLAECKESNIHTAVDTCGFSSYDAFDKISSKVDLFLYDIKMMDDEKHRRYTGVSNALILENLKRLAENGSKILLRLPIIPGINDDGDNIARIAEFMVSNDIKRISLLPYHRAGIEKYVSLDRAYKMKGTGTPSDESLKLIKGKFETFGLMTKIGG